MISLDLTSFKKWRLLGKQKGPGSLGLREFQPVLPGCGEVSRASPLVRLLEHSE
jgi:hypothetical protein